MSIPLGAFSVISTLNLEVANRLENGCAVHSEFRFILKIIDRLVGMYRKLSLKAVA